MRFVDATPLPARRQPPVGRPRSGACGAALAPRLPGRGVRAPGLGSARERRLAVRLCKGSRRRRRPVATHVAAAFAAGRRHVPAGVKPKGPRHAADGLRAPPRGPRVSPSPARTRIIAQMRGCAHRGRLRTATEEPSRRPYERGAGASWIRAHADRPFGRTPSGRPQCCFLEDRGSVCLACAHGSLLGVPVVRRRRADQAREEAQPPIDGRGAFPPRAKAARSESGYTAKAGVTVPVSTISGRRAAGGGRRAAGGGR